MSGTKLFNAIIVLGCAMTGAVSGCGGPVDPPFPPPAYQGTTDAGLSADGGVPDAGHPDDGGVHDEDAGVDGGWPTTK